VAGNEAVSPFVLEHYAFRNLNRAGLELFFQFRTGFITRVVKAAQLQTEKILREKEGVQNRNAAASLDSLFSTRASDGAPVFATSLKAAQDFRSCVTAPK
jgi:hypothetical protein